MPEKAIPDLKPYVGVKGESREGEMVGCRGGERHLMHCALLTMSLERNMATLSQNRPLRVMPSVLLYFSYSAFGGVQKLL